MSSSAGHVLMQTHTHSPLTKGAPSTRALLWRSGCPLMFLKSTQNNVLWWIIEIYVADIHLELWYLNRKTELGVSDKGGMHNRGQEKHCSRFQTLCSLCTTVALCFWRWIQDKLSVSLMWSALVWPYQRRYLWPAGRIIHIHTVHQTPIRWLKVIENLGWYLTLTSMTIKDNVKPSKHKTQQNRRHLCPLYLQYVC